MFSRISCSAFFISIFTALFTMMPVPAHSDTPVYSWQDSDGVITFTDDLSRAPGGARIKVFPAGARPQTASTETAATRTPSQPPSQPTRVATEGEFAIQLVEELGLSDDPTAEEAADILTDIRIVPRLGQWELNQPMTEELTVRLRNLAVAAAEAGRVTLTTDEVLLAFDTTAALLGLTVPVAIEPDEALDSPYPLAEAPPLVYVEPPPAVIYPYYTWFPVAGGFWWNGVLCSGFFVLDVNSFSKHHGFRGHHGGWDSGRIGHQFRSRIVDRRFVRNPASSNTGRVRSVAARSSGANRFLNRPARPHNVMRSPGTRLSGGPSERRHFSQRPATQSVTRPTSMSPAGRRQSFSYRPVNRMSAPRPAPQNSPGRYTSGPAPSRSFSGGPRITSPGRGFGTGGAGMGINRSVSGFAGRGSFRGR